MSYKTSSESHPAYFDSLPSEICGVIFQLLDPRGLSTAVQVCSSWKARGSNQNLWRDHALRFVPFTTILSKEFVEQLPTMQVSLSGTLILKEVSQRCEKLRSHNNLLHYVYVKPKWPPEGYLIDKDIVPYGKNQASDPSDFDARTPTWRDLYRLLALCYNSRRTKRIPHFEGRIRKAQSWILKQGNDEMSVAILKTILVQSSQRHMPDEIFETAREVHIPHILEFMAQIFSFEDARPQLHALAQFGVKAAARACFELELKRTWYRLTEGDVMSISTVDYFNKLSLREIMEILVLPVAQNNFTLPASEDDLLQLVFQIAEGRHDFFSKDQLVKKICILFLFHKGHFESVLESLCKSRDESFFSTFSRMVSYLLSSESRKTLVESVLRGLFADPAASPTFRFRAACALVQNDLEVLESDVEAIPGYPMPWTAPVAIPDHMRRTILKHYALSIEHGTDPRLVLEAHFIPDLKTESSAPWGDPEGNKTQQLVIAGLKGYGPISAGWWYAQGQGTFNVYKIYCEPIDEASMSPFGVVACYVSTLGPYFYTERLSRDQQKYLPKDFFKSNPLPTADEAEAAIRAWAAEQNLTDISDVAEVPFQGLATYFFRWRMDLPIRDLLFYWQD